MTIVETGAPFVGPVPPPTAKSQLRSVVEAVEVGTKLTRSWFRGQPKAWGTLVPRVFRDEFSDNFVRTMRPELEAEICDGFMRDAPAVADFVPPPREDVLAWLFIMQHFGTPTRLLDWTESILVALHFAVANEGHWHEDGEVWAMYPLSLNDEAGFPGWPFPKAPPLQYLATEAVAAQSSSDRHLEHYREAMGDPEAPPPEAPLAFMPVRSFTRMLVQTSVFTIHPKPAQGLTIPELLLDPRFLVRYIVPAESKTGIREGLEALAVDTRSLFPDFAGLSGRIEREAATLLYSPPLPPIFT